MTKIDVVLLLYGKCAHITFLNGKFFSSYLNQTKRTIYLQKGAIKTALFQLYFK